ncbi:hypothetical protein TanjilG_17322 [Lupinus angustifolius]|uniref:Protein DETOXIFICATION n=1 Tax=Lupinus angustifolius TaxID=3871 RepID=A0A4P1R1C5_LUPAN|nr:hypothetical protein TanjilG_17322 [Lupinus angustifolius]
MALNLTLSPSSLSTFPNHHLRRRFLLQNATLTPNLRLTPSKHRLVISRVAGGHELTTDSDNNDRNHRINIDENTGNESEKKELTEQSIWNQMKEIVMFTGPATGLWICGPLMSLIDTAVIGQGSSIQLAALGPATDREEVQHHISVLLFVGLACGIVMLLFTRLYGAATLTAFAGAKNVHVVPAANTYVQVVAAYMMIQNLNNKGYNAYAFSVPSGEEFFTILALAAPVFLTMMSKVAFYSLLIYFATSMGTLPMAAHQVMVQIYTTCTVWGEPLSQTAQSFMPGLMYGVNRNLAKARLLLRSLVIIGGILGLLLGIVGTSVPWLFPYIFTSDQMVTQEMHRVLIPYFVALAVTPPTLSLEGTLLAGRELRFISLSTSACFCLGALILLIVSSRYGLQGCWFTLAGFQWARFSMALLRLLSPNGILYSEDLGRGGKLLPPGVGN